MPPIAASAGYNVSQVLVDAGTDTVLWSRNTDIANSINTEHRNQVYLEDFELPRQLAALIDSTTDSIWSVDRELRLVMFNRVSAEAYRVVYGGELTAGLSLDEIAALRGAQEKCEAENERLTGLLPRRRTPARRRRRRGHRRH
mgnify:CR=1 FL=1